jgi:phage gp29-like protein
LGNLPDVTKRFTNNTQRRPYTIDLEKWEPYIKLWPIDEAGRIIYDVTHASYLDPARHIVHRGHDLTEFRDNWGGPGRSLLIWWLYRQLGRFWFAKGMENYGTPWPIGFTNVTDPQAVRLLHDAFKLSKVIGGLVVDENTKVELKEAMVAGMANGHEIFHNICNSAISFRITGLKESKKPAGLNAGEGKFQQNVREDVRVHDQMTLAETCKKQIVWPFRDLNNLRGDVKFIWGGLSDADAKTFADLLYTMRQAGYQLAEDSIPIANERTSLCWERSPVAPAIHTQSPVALPSAREED